MDKIATVKKILKINKYKLTKFRETSKYQEGEG